MPAAYAGRRVYILRRHYHHGRMGAELVLLGALAGTATPKRRLALLLAALGAALAAHDWSDRWW